MVFMPGRKRSSSRGSVASAVSSGASFRTADSKRSENEAGQERHLVSQLKKKVLSNKPARPTRSGRGGYSTSSHGVMRKDSTPSASRNTLIKSFGPPNVSSRLQSSSPSGTKVRMGRSAVGRAHQASAVSGSLLKVAIESKLSKSYSQVQPLKKATVPTAPEEIPTPPSPAPASPLPQIPRLPSLKLVSLTPSSSPLPASPKRRTSELPAHSPGQDKARMPAVYMHGPIKLLEEQNDQKSVASLAGWSISITGPAYDEETMIDDIVDYFSEIFTTTTTTTTTKTGSEPPKISAEDESYLDSPVLDSDLIENFAKMFEVRAEEQGLEYDIIQTPAISQVVSADSVSVQAPSSPSARSSLSSEENARTQPSLAARLFRRG